MLCYRFPCPSGLPRPWSCCACPRGTPSKAGGNLRTRPRRRPRVPSVLVLVLDGISDRLQPTVHIRYLCIYRMKPRYGVPSSPYTTYLVTRHIRSASNHQHPSTCNSISVSNAAYAVIIPPSFHSYYTQLRFVKIAFDLHTAYLPQLRHHASSLS